MLYEEVNIIRSNSYIFIKGSDEPKFYKYVYCMEFLDFRAIQILQLIDGEMIARDWEIMTGSRVQGPGVQNPS